jgi:tetratricopeptide (TPR) repeat protein
MQARLAEHNVVQGSPQRARLFWPVAIVLGALVFATAGCGSPAVEGIAVTPALPGPAGTPADRLGSDVASHIAAGQAALESGNPGQAEQEYRDALALDPKSARAQFGLGNLYVRLNRLSEAEQAFKAAIANDPKMTAAQTNLGVVYYQLGQLGQAASALQEALRVEPDDPSTLYLLAAVRLQEGNYPEAEKLLVQARDRKPDLPEVYYGLGVLYRLTGQSEKAIQAFEKFLSLGPGQDPAAADKARQELKQLKGQ